MGAKLGVGADLNFFVSYVQKYRTFSHTTQQSTIDRPSKPCPMASKSSGDGHHSHPTPSPMPSLASVALEAVNFAVGLMKQPPRQRKDGVMLGSCCSSAEDVLGGGTNETIGSRPARIGLINNREGGGRPGDVTINWVEGDGGGKHNNYFALEPGANSRPSTACLAPEHNNKQQPPSFVVANERRMRLFAMDMQTNNNQPKNVEVLFVAN